ncbi:MAG: hypothetical protein Q8S84_09305 [bacterium]|nr:hypothetical protein [bacterium]
MIICKKKNPNIINTPVIQSNIAISDKFIQVIVLNKYNINIDAQINAKSTNSCNSFIIIT